MNTLLKRLTLLMILFLAITLPFVGTAAAADDSDVLALVNAHRANNGLAPLCLNSMLSAAAYAHSADMSAQNYFDHIGLNGSTPWDRIAASGYQGGTMAENIAMGYPSAASVVQGWIDSPGHNANLLNPNVTEMGLGRYGDYWTQTFGDANRCSKAPVETQPIIGEDREPETVVIVTPTPSLPVSDSAPTETHGGEPPLSLPVEEPQWHTPTDETLPEDTSAESGYYIYTDEYGVTWEVWWWSDGGMICSEAGG
jgi:hypothetical protein